ASAPVRRRGSTGEWRSLDACLAQRAADRRRDLPRAGGIAVDADRVVVAGAGKAHRLLGGDRWIQQRARLGAWRKASVGQHEAVGEALAVGGNTRAAG